METTRNGQTAILLKKLGINPAHNGWKYLNEAINLTLEDERYLNNMTASMYPTVAKKFNVTDKSVERCMRYVIEISMTKAPVAALKAVFGNSIMDWRMTNSQFIATCAQVIEDEPNNPIWKM